MNGCSESLRSYAAFKRLCKEGSLSEALEAGDAVYPKHCTDMLHRLLQDCLKNEDFALGRKLQNFLVCSGLDSSSYLAIYLIRLFALCGRSSEAHQIFWKLPEKNVYAWTALIIAYTNLGQCLRAIELHCDMQKVCVKPDGHCFVALLKACGSITALPEGRLIHTHITEMGLEANLFIFNTLVDMYAKAGCMEDSTRLFDGFQNKDVTTWNAMISGFYHCGYVSNAFELFEQLQKEDGVEPNIVTWNAMIAGCVQYGLYELAFELFLKMQQGGLLPDKLTWNSLISAYIPHDCCHALQLYSQMQMEGVEPDTVTFMYIFKACSSISSLNHARFLHSQMIEIGIHTSAMIGSSLIDMYGKCGDLQAAVKVFNHRLTKKDLVSWNTIIAAHIHHSYCQESFHFFQQMQREGIVPRQVTFVLMLKACSDIGHLYEGNLLHSYVIESCCEVDIFVGTALIDLYMKCGNVGDARIIFDKMPSRGLVTWSALVAGYSWHGYADEASWLLQQMQEDGVNPTVVTWNGLIRGCAYNGLCAEAFENFQQMLLDNVEPNEATLVGVLSSCCVGIEDLKQGEVMYSYILEGGWENNCNTGSTLINMYSNSYCLQASLWIFNGLSKQEMHVWSAMIEAFVQHQYYQEAIQASQRMQQEGLWPNQIILASILKACVGAKMIYQSKLAHVLALELGFESDKLVGHSLINVYAKCGSLNDAWSVFHKVLNRDEVTWSAIMEGCAEHNEYKLALQCFQGMQVEDLDPNDVSFLSLLSACSRTGLIEEACCYFSSMRSAYSIAPTFTHYTCMADLFGRTGHLIEADDLLQTMPDEPNFVGHLCLLNHCKTYGNYQVGKDYFERTYDSTCRHSASYDCLSEICANIGNWRDSSGLNELKKCANAWKKPGGALVELENGVQFFTVGGRGHLQTRAIYSTLKKYAGQLEEEGYVPHHDIKVFGLPYA